MPHHFPSQGEHLLAARKTPTQRSSDDSPSVDLAQIPARTSGWPHFLSEWMLAALSATQTCPPPTRLNGCATFWKAYRLWRRWTRLLRRRGCYAERKSGEITGKRSGGSGKVRVVLSDGSVVWLPVLEDKSRTKSSTAVDIDQRPTVHCLHRLWVDDTEAAASQLCS